MSASVSTSSAPTSSPRPQSRPTSAPTSSPRPEARPEGLGKSDATSATGTSDGVALSSETASAAESAAPENPYEGVAEGVTSVKVEPWSPENTSKSTLDGILQSQGYTPEEIYGKGEDGKSLLDRVATTNNLENPNLIYPDQELQIPQKTVEEEKDEASISSDDVAAGESETTVVQNEEERMSARTTVSKDEDGAAEATVESRNHANPDANLTSEMETPSGGKVASASQETDDGVESVTMGRNEDGSAVTVHDQAVTSEGSDLSITDEDENKNMIGAVVDEQLTVLNPGTTEESGDVRSNVDLSESANDGAFENFGRGVAEFFGVGGEEQQDPVTFEDASGVAVNRGNEGETSVLVDRGGEVEEVYSSAGDTDDSWVEQGGEAVDNFIDGFTPDIPRSEDPNYELTRRGYRRINNGSSGSESAETAEVASTGSAGRRRRRSR